MTQRRRRAQVERTPYADCPLCFGAGVIHNWEVDRPCMRCFERRAVERTPEREVFRGVSASMWFVDDYGLRGVRSDDDYTDALAFVWSRVPAAARAELIQRRAVERTGRVLVAWLIGRWRR